MKINRLLFAFILTLLSAFLLTGCDSDQNTVSENAITAKVSHVTILEERSIKPINYICIIEACEALSADPSDYLLIPEGTDVSKIQLHFEEVNPRFCSYYQVSASYEEETAAFIIQIVDTIAPVITAKSEHPIIIGYNPIGCDKLVTVSDNSYTSLKFKESNWNYFYPEEPGEYELEIIAEDKGHNTSSITVTFTIEPFVFSLNPATVEQIQNEPALPTAFKNYLVGKKTAVTGKNIHFESWSYFWSFQEDIIKPGQSASIMDVFDMINAPQGNGIPSYYVTDVYYGLLDCGMDGKMDLAVAYDFGILGMSEDHARLMTVIHEENGRLTMNFATQSGTWGTTVLYQDGCYIDLDNYDHFYKGILDKTGTLNAVYSCDATVGAWSFDVIDPEGEARLAAFGYASLETLSQDESFREMKHLLEIDEYKIDGETYYVYFIANKATPTQQKRLLKFLSICEENGTKLYSIEEIDQLIAERLDSLGFSSIDHDTGTARREFYSEWVSEHKFEDRIQWIPLSVSSSVENLQ